MSWPSSPLCLNMNAPTHTSLSPQLALTVKDWSHSGSHHLLPFFLIFFYLVTHSTGRLKGDLTMYLLPIVLPTEKWLRGLLYEHVLTNEIPYIENSFSIFTELRI